MERGSFVVSSTKMFTSFGIDAPISLARMVVATGQTLLSNFDIYQTAGGKDVAYSQDFLVTATNGQIVLTFKTDKDNALVSGIEVLKP